MASQRQGPPGAAAGAESPEAAAQVLGIRQSRQAHLRRGLGPLLRVLP